MGVTSSSATLLPSEILMGRNLWWSCASCHRLWLHMCDCPVVSGKRCPLGIFHNLWFFTIFLSFSAFALIIESWVDWHNINIQFRTEHPKVSYSLHINPLQVAVLIVIYCKKKKKTLGWGMSEALIHELSNMSLENDFAIFILQNNSGMFSPGPHDLSCLRLLSSLTVKFQFHLIDQALTWLLPHLGSFFTGGHILQDVFVTPRLQSI